MSRQPCKAAAQRARSSQRQGWQPALIAASLLALASHAAAQASGGAFDCASALSKQLVVLYAGDEPPYLNDLTNLMPSHTINISEGAVSLLSLSDPTQAACAKSITDITDTLMVWENGKLPTVLSSFPTGLSTPKGQLIIKGKQGRDVAGITNLTFLSNLKSVGGLSVYNMDGLETLKGLSGLKTINGDLIVSENDNLRNMTGLDSLQSVGGDVIFNSNMNIKTLDGLGALQTIGGQLFVKGQGYLMNLDALSSLQRIGKSASFPNNGNVQMRLPPTVAVGADAPIPTGVATNAGQVLVIHGSKNPPSVQQVISACDTFMPPLSKFDLSAQRMRFQSANQSVQTDANGVFPGNIVVFDDGKIQSLQPALGGVRNITGSLLVLGGEATGVTATGPGLTTLNGCDNIVSVADLGIIDTTRLMDLTGLSGLRYIQKNLVLQFNPMLTSLAGVGAAAGGLSVIGGEIWIEGNRNLKNLTGLENLSLMGWRLSLIDNHKLENLEGLRSLKRIGGGLVLHDNWALKSSAGLRSLESVGGSITIMYNTNLTDVTGLSRLSKLPGDFALAGNPIRSVAPLQNLTSVGLQFVLARTQLTDLSGLSSLTSVGGGLSVTANPRLTSLHGLSGVTQVGDDLSIRQNPQLTSLSQLDTSLQTVGGGVYIEDNPALVTLGSLPDTLTGIGGLVTVRRNGAVPDTQVTTLRTKQAKEQGVPDTVALLPGLIEAHKAAHPIANEDNNLLISVMTMNTGASGMTAAAAVDPVRLATASAPGPSPQQAAGNMTGSMPPSPGFIQAFG